MCGGGGGDPGCVDGGGGAWETLSSDVPLGLVSLYFFLTNGSIQTKRRIK